LANGYQFSAYGIVNRNRFSINLCFTNLYTILGYSFFFLAHRCVSNTEIIELQAHDMVNPGKLNTLSCLRSVELNKSLVWIIAVNEFFNLILEEAPAQVIAGRDGNLLKDNKCSCFKF